MSIQAVAWALRQELPPVPKFVLVALCERANGKTGQCWPGIDEVAEAVCLSERSVITYIAALVRNGYVVKQSMRRKNGQRTNNHYWICFDRGPAAWVGPGGQVEEMPPAENDESDGSAESENAQSPPCADFAHGDNVQIDSHGPCATAFTYKDSAEPESLKPESAPSRFVRSPPEMPQGFEPSHRLNVVERQKAADEARKPERIPVIRGSEPWQAHVRAGHPDDLYTTIEINGRKDRGWYFKSLYPLKGGTGPPQSQSSQSAPDLKKNTG